MESVRLLKIPLRKESNKTYLLIIGVVTFALAIATFSKSIIMAQPPQGVITTKPGGGGIITTTPPPPGMTAQVINSSQSSYTVFVNDAPFGLGLTSNRPNPVFSYNISDASVISLTDDKRVKPLKAGTVILTVSEPGNNVYTGAELQLNITVQKRDQSITLAPLKIPKNVSISPNPTTTGDNNVFTYTIESGSPQYIIMDGTTKIKGVNIGTNVGSIRVSQAGNNIYNPASIVVPVSVIERTTQYKDDQTAPIISVDNNKTAQGVSEVPPPTLTKQLTDEAFFPALTLYTPADPTMPTNSKDVVLTSSNTNIAEITSDNTIKPKAVGETVITIYNKENSDYKESPPTKFTLKIEGIAEATANEVAAAVITPIIIYAIAIGVLWYRSTSKEEREKFYSNFSRKGAGGNQDSGDNQNSGQLQGQDTTTGPTGPTEGK